MELGDAALAEQQLPPERAQQVRVPAEQDVSWWESGIGF